MSPFTVGLVQMNSAREFAPNIESARTLIGRARDEGAELLRTYWTIPERQIETSVVLAR